MKFKTIILLIFSFGQILCYSQTTIELPIKLVAGFGPFTPKMLGLQQYDENQDNPWVKTYLNTTGIPRNWNNVKRGEITNNQYQTVYQSYISGDISQKWYDYIQKGWFWIPDTLNMSKQPIKCKIAFAYGEDENGETKMVIDTNNNLDFRDDNIFSPIDYNIIAKPDMKVDALLQKITVLASFERLENNRIVQENISVLVTYNKELGVFLYNFPNFYTTNFQGNNIAICSDDFCSTSFNKSTKIILFSNDYKVDKKNVTETNEIIDINNKSYINKGVNPYKNVLVLENIGSKSDITESTKVGYHTISFEGKNFKTNKLIRTDDYKGKYLLIDFWGTWCKPCIQELPNLKEIYGNIDKSKFEIIGIVVNSSNETLTKVIDENSITWPQIVSDSRNRINEVYGISSYPTTYLLDTTGVIIAKNLTGNELKKKIYELTNQQNTSR